VPFRLLAGVAVAGCGGDDLDGDDDQVTTSGPLVPSKRDYISQADGLCAFYESRVEELGPTLREELDEVRAITPPAGDEAQVAAIFDAAARAVDGLEADPATFVDDAAVRRLFADARRTGRRYGLQECGL
jgi:hypothetical protein